MSFNQLLNQSAQLENKSEETDRHGKPTFSGGREVRIRFEQTSKIIATADKEREPIDGRVFMLPSETVSKGDRLTYAGNAYRVMLCSPVVLGNGSVHHFELLVQHWSY